MKFRPVIALALVLAALASCGRGGRVIPSSTMSDIYADMFMADQWINQNQRARKTADTTNFYAPILREYGYTVEDYDATVKHYLRKPDKYAKILKSAAAKMNRKAKRLEAIEDALAKRVKFSPYQPSEFRYDTLRFRDDSLGLWPNDSSFTVPGPLDTLALADSLAVPADSSAVAPADSSTHIIKDTINNQSYGQNKPVKEMLLLHGPDDTSYRRHTKLRKVSGGQSEPSR